MRHNDFATLQRGERIEVKEPRAGFSIWIVCGEPHDGNTLVDAIPEDGRDNSKPRGIYFRDVIQRRVKPQIQCDCETRNCEVSGRHVAGNCKNAPQQKVRFTKYGVAQNLCNECLTICWKPEDYQSVKIFSKETK